MHFSAAQARLLRKIKRSPRLRSSLSKKELLQLSYLDENGLIRYDGIYENEKSIQATDLMVHIKPKGEAEYEYLLSERRKWLIPVLISVAALVISILAIISSSQTISVYIDNQKNNSFTTSTTNAIISAETPK